MRGTDAAATGVLAFFNYGLDITGNSFTGALGPGNTVLVSPVGYYVLDFDQRPDREQIGRQCR